MQDIVSDKNPDNVAKSKKQVKQGINYSQIIN